MNETQNDESNASVGPRVVQMNPNFSLSLARLFSLITHTD